MTYGKPRDPRKEQQWRHWIDQWRRSGLSVQAFCQRHGLATPSFYAWRRTLRQRDAAAFVPVRLRHDEPAAAGTLEVVLAGGRRLRVPPAFDPAAVGQLLDVLEGRPPC